MGGTALARAVRKIDSQAPIIAMSGLTSREQTAELQSLNVNAFLSKPYTAETLLKVLAEILPKKIITRKRKNKKASLLKKRSEAFLMPVSVSEGVPTVILRHTGTP